MLILFYMNIKSELFGCAFEDTGMDHFRPFEISFLLFYGALLSFTI